MQHIERDYVYQAICGDCLVFHNDIITDLYLYLDSTDTVKSHFFNGRYENIYITAEKISGLATVLNRLQAEAAKQLHTQTEKLKLGYWFNIMQQDDVTLPHSHDDDDELLSGTYYLQMPTGSGKLLLHHPYTSQTIAPIEGQLVFFHPAVEHEVTQHQSSIPRISLGFNIGPLHDNENN